MGFGVLHLGDHNIAAGVRHFENLGDYEKLKNSLTQSFSQADATGALHTLTQQFPGNTFSLRTLFRDEQRKIVNLILNDSLATTAAAYRTIYEGQAALIRFLTGLRIPVPTAFQAAAEIALNNQVKQAFEREEPDTEGIQGHLKEAAASNVKLDVPGLEYTIRKRLEREAATFAAQATNLEVVQKLRKLLEFVATLPFPVTLWEVQNISYAPLIKAIDELRPGAENHIGTENILQELNLLRDKLRINGK